MWNKIEKEDDLNNFMNILKDFHDSCIKEFKYTSGAYVDKDLSMYPINDKRKLRMIIQRQSRNPAVVEIEFSGLYQFNYYPVDENQTCEILEATMLLKNECIYWCDCGGLSENDFSSYEGTMICAKRIRWRIADEYIGSSDVY